MSAGVSLLQRLMKDFPLYQKTDGVFDNRYVTKLLHNYRSGCWGYSRALGEEITVCDPSPDRSAFLLSRSHPAILKVPNELFYDEELQACADVMLRNSYCGWEYLPKTVVTPYQACARFFCSD